MNKFLHLSDEVKNALSQNKPIVALESTIISHGMPYPQNVETALRVEEIVRQNGAVPSTIALVEGKLVVGCSHEQIELLGKLGQKVDKVSRRDIPFIVARGGNGATTVAATMFVASLAGVKVFATGGIGGAHREAQQTFDISADLDELKETSVLVVCAGAKSILDLALTLECLETRGVAVVGFQTDELPAFYTQKSGFKVDFRLDSPHEIARAFHCKEEMGLRGGMLVTNPVPQEFSFPPEKINLAIENALAECKKLGISGKNTTPYLLDKIQKLTDGQSLKSNIELVFNNARLASKIAVELAKM